MSFNLNVNDDFYDSNNKRTSPKSFNNSSLSFGQMPAQPNQSYAYQHQQQFTQNTNNSQFYSQTDNFYSIPNQTAQTNFYADWSQQQFFNPAEVVDKNDPFSQNMTFDKSNQFETNAVDFENEPPLLEELGINFSHIFQKTKCVLNPFAKPHESIIHDEDLAGPLVFCIAYGFSLLLVGKIQFGYIYGITALGCLCMYSLLNLMSEQGVSAVCIGSTLGYCLLPMVLLSFLSSLFTLNGVYGLAVSLIFIFWCSMSSSKLFVYALNMSNQQLLVLYPCFLLYGIFALLNVF